MVIINIETDMENCFRENQYLNRATVFTEKQLKNRINIAFNVNRNIVRLAVEETSRSGNGCILVVYSNFNPICYQI